MNFLESTKSFDSNFSKTVEHELEKKQKIFLGDINAKSAVATGAALGVIAHFSQLQDGFNRLGNFIATHILYSASPSPSIQQTTPIDHGLELSPIGKYLGGEVSGIITSFSGSLIGLTLNTLAVAGGLSLRSKNPVVGYTMIGFGVTNHLLASIQPWNAALMTDVQLQQAAANGHSFANISVQFSNLTGISAHTIALTTAIGWTIFFPVLFLGVYLKNRGSETCMVSDAQALKQFMINAQKDEKCKKLLQDILNIYPQKQALENIEDEKSLEEVEKFITYLFQNLPDGIVQEMKQEVIDQWKNQGEQNRIKKTMNYISAIGLVAYTASSVIKILSETFFPVLQGVSSALAKATPVFAVLSLASSIYETINDCTNVHLSKRAKMLSVAKLVSNIVIYTVFTVAVFVPGAQGAIIAAIVLGYAGLLITSYLKNRVIKKDYELQQAIERENFIFMSNWLIELKEKQTIIDSKALKFQCLIKWINSIKIAEKKHLLSDDQKVIFKGLASSFPAFA